MQGKSSFGYYQATRWWVAHDKENERDSAMWVDYSSAQTASIPCQKGKIKKAWRRSLGMKLWTVWNRMGPNSHWRFFLFSSWRKVRQLATHVRSYARTVVTRQICMRLPTMRFWSGIFHKLIAISLRQLRLSLSTLPVETKSFSFLQTCVDEVFNEVYSFLVVESWSTECGLRLIGQIPRFQLTVVAGRYAVSLLRV
jgi:hypothetical protein